MNRTFRHLLVPCVLALVSTTAACELISSVDRSNIGGTGGSGGTSTSSQTTGTTATGTGGAATSSGTGGTGGAMTSTSSGMGGAGGGSTSSSSSSASSSSSSSSSSSGGMNCTMPTDCPMPASPCVTRLCTAGACTTGFVLADTPTAAQVPGDCKQVVCDGAGATINGDDDTDVPSDNEVCTADSCFAGSPVHMPVAKGTDCTAQGPAPKHLCGDPAGLGAGKCVECNAAADCGAGKNCVANVCQ